MYFEGKFYKDLVDFILNLKAEKKSKNLCSNFIASAFEFGIDQNFLNIYLVVSLVS